MEGRTIEIPNASNKVKSGHFCFIGKYIPGVLKVSDLPKKVIVKDPETKNEFQCELKTVLPFTDSIPEIFTLLSEGKQPEDCIEEIYTRTNTKSFNELAVYIYGSI